MPARKINTEDKCVPRLSFKVPLEIIFSLSIDYKTSEDFKLAAGNNNDTVSKVLRDILFKRLTIKSKKDFSDWMYKIIKEAKREIYSKLNVSRNSSFSKIIVEDIKKYNGKIK